MLYPICAHLTSLRVGAEFGRAGDHRRARSVPYPESVPDECDETRPRDPRNFPGSGWLPTSPPVAFPVYGLDASWPGARWLDLFGDQIGDPPRWVALGHETADGQSLIMVNTYSKPPTDAQAARAGQPPLAGRGVRRGPHFDQCDAPGAVGAPARRLPSAADRARPARCRSERAVADGPMAGRRRNSAPRGYGSSPAGGRRSATPWTTCTSPRWVWARGRKTCRSPGSRTAARTTSTSPSRSARAC